jgi:hypothetical protein
LDRSPSRGVSTNLEAVQSFHFFVDLPEMSPGSFDVVLKLGLLAFEKMTKHNMMNIGFVQYLRVSLEMKWH